MSSLTHGAQSGSDSACQEGSVLESQLLHMKLAFLTPASHPQVFDFTFSPEEMKQLDALNKNWRYIVPMLTVSIYQLPELGNVRFGEEFWPQSGLNLGGQRRGGMLLVGLLSWTQRAPFS